MRYFWWTGMFIGRIFSNPFGFLLLPIFTPIRGTKVYEEYKEKLITNNPEHFDYLHVTFNPTKISVRKYYLYYYILLIKLFLLAKKQGVYDFIDYGYYIKSFIKNIFKKGNE